MAGDFDATLAVFKDGVNNLPASALGVLHRGALAACDGKDGVADGVIEDPRAARSIRERLSCKAGQAADSCLTPPQVAAARRVYAGLKDPKSGEQLYPGLAPGSEPFWPNRDPANPFPIPISHYKWLVFADPNWDWKTFDFSDPPDYESYRKAEAKLAPIMNATSPDLQAFRAARRQAAAVSRLERPAHHAAQQHRLLRERAHALWRRPRSSGNDCRRAEFLPVVHGAGDGALRRRLRSEHFRHAVCARTLDRAGHRTRPDRGDAGDQRRRRSSPSVVRVSSGRRLPRQRRHQRRGKLRVPRPVNARLN